MAGWLFALALAASATPACHHEDGYLDGPFVPDAATAKAIYIAVRQKQVSLKHFPVIRITDEGDHWAVSEGTLHPNPNQLGGGQFYVSIDKCSGAISHSAYNR